MIVDKIADKIWMGGSSINRRGLSEKRAKLFAKACMQEYGRTFGMLIIKAIIIMCLLTGYVATWQMTISFLMFGAGLIAEFFLTKVSWLLFFGLGIATFSIISGLFLVKIGKYAIRNRK